ncbi:MAG: hypothetical protein ACTSRS_08835 [Candidatus Helarchaeota archaeon]
MDLIFKVPKDLSQEEVKEVIRSALDLDKRIVKYKREKYFDICKKFERKYKMNSDTFMEKFEGGELDDRDDFFDWYAAKKGFEKLNKKLNILSGINL